MSRRWKYGPTPLWFKVQAAVDAAARGEAVTWIQAKGTNLPDWAARAIIEGGVRWVCIPGRVVGAKADFVVLDEVTP